MRYFDPENGAALEQSFEDLVMDWPAVTRETMFGCPSYRAGDTIFAVLVTDGIALTRLPEADREAIEAEFEAGPFEAGGRTIKKWVQVFVEDPATVDRLEPFIRSSYDAARTESA